MPEACDDGLPHDLGTDTVALRIVMMDEQAVQHRFRIFSAQVVGLRPTDPIPAFNIHAVTSVSGCCFSCGELLMDGTFGRCELCGEAARRVVAALSGQRTYRRPADAQLVERYGSPSKRGVTPERQCVVCGRSLTNRRRD